MLSYKFTITEQYIAKTLISQYTYPTAIFAVSFQR